MIYPSSDGSLQKYLEEVLAEEKKEWSVKEICEKVSCIGGTSRRARIYHVLSNLERKGVVIEKSNAGYHNIEKVYLFK